MRRLLVAPLCLMVFACQSSRYVTQDQLKELTALPAPYDPQLSVSHQKQVNDLVLAAFTAPDPPVRTAAALGTTDQRLAPLTAALSAIDRAVEICARNLANADTTAYKASYAASEPGGMPYFRIDFTQGSMENTGRQLDLGITGQGFFKLKLSNSESGGFAYTRNGNFFVNKSGELTLGMGDGYRLVPSIVVPKGVTDISISQDGLVQVTKAGSGSIQTIGQFTLFQFMNPQDLNHLGGSLYTQSESSGPPIESKPNENGAGEVLQGFLESSNVDPTRERLRIRFLQNWRNTILRAVDDAK
jgi:flagellar basal body rod protein FlgG